MSDSGRIREVYRINSDLPPELEGLRQEINLHLKAIGDRLDEIEGRRVEAGPEGRFCTFPWERNDGFKSS